MSDKPKINWSWGLAAAIAMTLLSLYPHFYFSLSRAGQWHGSYAAIEGVGDEVAYSAYLNALLNNRPRRSDPQAPYRLTYLGPLDVGVPSHPWRMMPAVVHP